VQVTNDFLVSASNAKTDRILLAVNDKQKGINNIGTRDFEIFAQGAKELSIATDGDITSHVNINAPSIGRPPNDTERTTKANP
jgi:hypothetical protein